MTRYVGEGWAFEVNPPFPMELAPGPDDYLGFYVNVHGEPMIFVGRPYGQSYLVHGDNLAAEGNPYAVENGVALGIIMHKAERDWVACCWHAIHPSVDGQVGPTLLERGLMPMVTALRYIARPTMGLPSGVTDLREFVLHEAKDELVRLALSTCIDVAQRALHDTGISDPD